LVLAKAEVNCRADSARVRVDILDHQEQASAVRQGVLETNPQERAIA